MLSWIKKQANKIRKKPTVADVNPTVADVEFSLLTPRGTDRDALVEQLSSLGVNVKWRNDKTSDYIKCSTTKENFCKLFSVSLEWRTLEVGSWEIKENDEGIIPDTLKIKTILLHRNILFPHGFIKNTTIEK
jgi:hypothetical protein